MKKLNFPALCQRYVSRLRRACACVLAAATVACAPPRVPKAQITELETGADGRSYIKGTHEGYTGNMIQLGRNSAKLEEWNYVNGWLDGGNIRYNEATGEIRRRVDYAKGQKVRKRVWYPGGQLKADESLDGRIVHGLCTYWFPDGRIRKQMTFIADFRPDGQLLEFAEDGRIIFDVILDQGRYVSGTYDPDFTAQMGRRYASEKEEEEEDGKPEKKENNKPKTAKL